MSVLIGRLPLAVGFASVRKRTTPAGLGSLATGAVTALGIAVQTGLAAIVGVVIARKLGRTAETDGFFAAYGVFIVLALAATAVRVTVLPPLARAREAGRLSSETASYALAVGAVSVPLFVATVVAARPIAELLTGFGPDAAVDAAETALPWMVVAGLGQFTAGLLASTLAALDDYVVPALAFIAGSATGLVLLLVRIDENRTEAVAWGMALNAVLATTLMATALWRRSRREQVPTGAARADLRGIGSRLLELGSGAALPFALQAIYLVCLPIAAREGVGSVTSFGYAYLIAAAVVSVSASSLGLVTAVPLTRRAWSRGVSRAMSRRPPGPRSSRSQRLRGSLPSRAPRSPAGSSEAHTATTSGPRSAASSLRWRRTWWPRSRSRSPSHSSSSRVAAVGSPSSGSVCWRSTSRSPSRGRRSQVSTGSRSRWPSRRPLRSAWMLTLLHAARSTTGRLALAVAVVAGCALVGFVPAGALLGPAGAVLGGLALSAAALAVVRPVGLRTAWHYLRELA